MRRSWCGRRWGVSALTDGATAVCRELLMKLKLRDSFILDQLFPCLANAARHRASPSSFHRAWQRTCVLSLLALHPRGLKLVSMLPADQLRHACSFPG